MARFFKHIMVVAIVVAWGAVGWVLSADRTAASEPGDQPRRVVSLTPDVTELLFALGLGEKVVGVSTFCDYPPEATTRPKVGTYWEPDIEAIIACRPDLIAGEDSSKSDVLRRLGRIGYRTASLRLNTIAELLAAIDAIAGMTRRTAEAETLKNSMATRLGTVSAAVRDRPRPRVLWVIQAQPLRVAGRDTFIN